MNVFHIGDPVMIIGGISINHCKLIGHATTVTSELMLATHKETGQRWDIHMVEESRRIFAGAALCYRPQDLMPLAPSKELTEELRKERISFMARQYGLNKKLQEILR